MDRLKQEELERELLKPYACFSDSVESTRSVKCNYRTDFQRDRDRIIHSKSFRRLEYKTQVFLTNKGDHLRTRLTHSLEVAQIARALALQLGVNSNLVEAIALGHDVGHTPFGHAGEKALKELTQNKFKHNIQSVKILELLEKKYHYDGLKLTLPVLEGILKHTELPDVIPEYCKDLYIDQPHSITIEGQIVTIADEIAQITHDMDDYLRFNVIQIQDYLNCKLFNNVKDFYSKKYNRSIEEDILNLDVNNNRKYSSLIRCLVDYLITTLYEQTLNELNEELKSYKLKKTYVKFNDKTNDIIEQFNKTLKGKLKSDYRIKEMDKRGKEIINTLYYHFNKYPEHMPPETIDLYSKKGEIVIIDFISGMTDRFAIDQYNKIVDLVSNTKR